MSSDVNTGSATSDRHNSTKGRKVRNKTSSASVSDGSDEASTGKRKRSNIFGSIQNLGTSRIYNFGCNKKPAELFRKDLISAMKLPDSEQLNSDDYIVITDPWKEEWEKGVQVPVNVNILPEPKVSNKQITNNDPNFKMPKKLIKCSDSDADMPASNYELDLLDLCWLESINQSDEVPDISENFLEDVINELEHQCSANMKTKQIGMEYDDHIICDVCRSPDAEDGNEMVFCDSCNICVHQACYGILEIPDGEWLCKPCQEFGEQKEISCALCPNLGGAFKPTTQSNQWCHVSCALWTPEVSIGCVTTMEPITKIKLIPQSRLNLICSLCNRKQGAPIQCSVKTCKVAFHVTCAFSEKLKMKAIVAHDGSSAVKLKSFCRKHTEKADEESSRSCNDSQNEETDNSQHEIEIISRESENEVDKSLFYMYIDSNKITQQFLPRLQEENGDFTTCQLQAIVDIIVQYWKLKRASNNGSPLIRIVTSASIQEVLTQQRLNIMRFRVDLERIRNLSYMICRREKIKRNWLITHQIIVEKAITFATGVSPSKSETLDCVYKSYHSAEEKANLAVEAINANNIYNEKGFHTMAPKSIVQQLEKYVKLDKFKKRQNPYAKFYLHRRSEEDSRSLNASNSQQNTNAFVNKPVNGVKSAHLLSLTPSSLSVNKKHFNGVNIAVENAITSEHHSSPSEKSPPKPRSEIRVPPAVITRSSALIGYKIPKKKKQSPTENNFNTSSRQETNELSNSSESLTRKSCNHQNNHRIQREMNFNDDLETKKLSKRIHFKMKNEDNNQRSIVTRAQSLDDSTLMASAASDVDMRINNFPQNVF